MPFMQWTEMLAIDGGDIDHQHRELVEAINDFHDALVLGKGTDEIEKTIAFLERYGENHFRDEERMLESAHYPELAQHKLLHQTFLTQLGAFRQRLRAGDTGLGYGMARFLGRWLVEHIMTEDKAYARFLRGVTPAARL